ncbi:MAG: TonB-dependent receptor [Acetobacteraceae bacterium]
MPQPLAALHGPHWSRYRPKRWVCPLVACLSLSLATPNRLSAQAANQPPDGAAAVPPSLNAAAPDVVLPPVDVVASREDLLGSAATASQGTVTQEELDLRPVFRVGQLLESVPGLVVTVHSGEGKANQYLIRGFNLDHGTDFATYVDDMPINEPTNAHGQGYSDVHFLMPELAVGIDYTKGPFYADIGDFGAMGSAHIKVADEIPTQMSVSAGTLRDDREFFGGTEHLPNGDRLLGALSVGHYDGPWSHPDDYNSYNGTVRYTHGDQTDGFDLMAMAYHGAGNLTTDQPVSAFQQGLISRFGTLDPSDGSYAERFSLNGHYYVSGDDWTVVTSGYIIHYQLRLRNDFTHYLFDPVQGDEEQQDETRFTAGGQTVYKRSDTLFGFPTETEFGLMGRHDNEYIDRRHDQNGVVLPQCDTPPFVGGLYVCAADRVSVADVGVWMSNTTHWTSWFRTIVGLREEYASGLDHDLITGSTGYASQAMPQPKGSVVFGPWAKTEFYVSAGQGFHSNDLRGVIENLPLAGVNATGNTPLLTRITSEEVGIRSDIIPRTNLTVAVFRENFASYLTYDQDLGNDDAGPPAQLLGTELSALIRPFPWMELSGDFNFTHSRYTANNPAQYGFSGLYIPNAPSYIGSFGVLIDHLGPWFGGAELRWLGPYPLLADNSLRSPGYKEVNLVAGYKFNDSMKIQLSIYNLFNTNAYAMQYAYEYQVSPTAAPQTGATYHPLEPLSARLTVTVLF